MSDIGENNHSFSIFTAFLQNKKSQLDIMLVFIKFFVLAMIYQ